MNNYFNIIYIIKYFFTKSLKKSLIINIIYSFLNGLAEATGLGFVISVIYLIIDSEKIHTNLYLNKLFKSLFFIESETQFILLIVIALPLVFFLKNAFTLFMITQRNKLIYDIAFHLTMKKYSSTLRYDMEYYSKFHSNEINRNVGVIPAEFSSNVMLQLMNLISELIILFILVFSIVIYNPLMFLLVSLIVLPFSILFYKKTSLKIKRYGDDIIHKRHKVYKDILESIIGIEEIKIYGKENYFEKRPINQLKNLFKIYINVAVIKESPSKVIEFLTILSISIILIVSLVFKIDLAQVTSSLLVFATLSYRLMPSVNRVLTSTVDIKNKTFVIEELKNTYHAQENGKQNRVLADQKFKSLKLINIEYFYSNKTSKTINKLNFEIKKGEKIGIVGESGSGKSTFLKIICCVIHPRKGDIILNNEILTNHNISTLQSKIGYVKQDFFLLDSSFVKNIAFGVEENNIDYFRLKKCIKDSMLDEIISKYPDKERTNIGEFGKNLSGGQKQRIAIARALYVGAEILIFDEATSALDDDTEYKIIETINHLQTKNLAIIMVAHRKSSLKFCDKIYEMKSGNLIQQT